MREKRKERMGEREARQSRGERREGQELVMPSVLIPNLLV